MKCAKKNPFISFCDERSIVNLPSQDYDVEKCLITLEEWMMSLLQNEESHGNISKLKYCYWCVNTIRSTLNEYEILEYEKIKNKVITVSKNLQEVLSSVGYIEYNNDLLSTIKCNQNRCILSPITRKCSTNKRKIRRKCRSHKRTKDNESGKKLYSSKQYELDFQYLIDQLYIQTKTVLADNCLDDVHLLKEFGGYIDKSVSTKSEIDCRSVVVTDKLLSDVDRKAQTKLWSGDCKINGDSRDSFSDTFDNILESSNSELDVVTLNDGLLPRYKKSTAGSHRSRLKRDSDFDEGFSENEFIDDVGTDLLVKKITERTSVDCRGYCGDCDYNSSNSKWDGVQNGDGSDSDGGTEILNSVNATVNKFNAIMQYNVTDTVSGPGQRKNSSEYTNDDDYVDRRWTVPLDPSLSSKRPPEHVTESPLPPLLFVPASYREERIESPSIKPVSQVHYQQSQQFLANVNGEPLSKMTLSPITIQNWCSFNINYLPSRSFNYYSKNTKSYDASNSGNENYDLQKLNPWLPCLSNNVPGTNCFHMSSNHRQQQQPQQQMHQILLPPINLNSMQHNIVHLPPIFHQSQHSAFDTEYLDRRYLSNNSKLFSGPNISDPVTISDSLAHINPISVVTNTNNHSNVSASKNNFCQTIFKASLDKSQRACCFYMRGGCKKEDCEYAHDLSKVTCKFWEKGDCFKSDTCPFKHGYHKD